MFPSFIPATPLSLHKTTFLPPLCSTTSLVHSPPRRARHSAQPLHQTSTIPPTMTVPAADNFPSPITFIGGGGNMATAIITGLMSAPKPPTIHASSPRLSSLSHLPLPESHKSTSNLSVASEARMVFLCVKPAVAPRVLEEISPAFATASPPILVSVVAGLSTEKMEEYLGLGTAPPVIRTMPNVASSCQAGVTGVCAGSTASKENVDAALAVLSAVGEAVAIPEGLFAPLSAVSGAGAAYLFMVAEALSDAATSHGIPRATARRLAAGTIYGAGKMLLDGEHAAVLRNKVESPGGVTIEATKELERKGLRGAFLDAIDKAVMKAKGMGDK